MAAVNAALDEFEAGTNPSPQPAPSSAASQAPSQAADSQDSLHLNSYKISGEVRTSAGIYSNGHTVFTRANADLNERNYRILSSEALNNNINTYDPALFSRLQFAVDASVAASIVSLHLNVFVDPWSFTAKSGTQLVTSQWGDQAKVQYLWWGNTNYTVNRIINTSRYGGSFALPELKPNGSTVPPVSVASSIQNQYGQTDVFNIPAEKLNYSFFPVREAWADIKPPNSDFKLRIFPMAFEDQALTTDDPLKLSNNAEWWDSSPWLNSWQPGNLNTGDNPINFTKGYWDNSLAFFTRDSFGQRLTALRGVSLSWKPGDETSVEGTVASPKTLWQNYSEFTTVPGAVRLKQFIGDLFYIGAVGNMHQGYTPAGDLDAENYVGAVDTGAMALKNVKFNAEVARSQSHYDETTPDYATKYNGNAYYVSLTASSNPENMLKKDYFGLLPQEQTDTFFKSTVYYARMDQGFESSLSNYHQTRDDSFWAENVTFYPSTYRYLPGVAPSQSQYDLEPFAVGTGIDYGRSVVRWVGDVNLLDGTMQGTADIRHVTDNYGHNIQTEGRTLWTYKPLPKLTTKALFLWDALPKTSTSTIYGASQTLDPFVTSGTTGDPLVDSAVTPGKDPSIKSTSLGARYQLTGWAALNGVWEYTNDVNLGTDSFPQGDLNSTFFSTYTQNGRLYTEEVPQLYDQQYFHQPPYPYYNIFKAGLEITPSRKWHIYMDYTRNPNKFAGNIDDNMQHAGIETSYLLTPKIGFFARYTFSQGYDINRLVNDHQLDYRNYNNFYFETRMILPKDLTMSLQYGVGPAFNVLTSATDPALAYYSTTVLETQHIVRIVFDKKF
ncbi:MAG: hypothetical protein KGJ61_06185 [Candidatus Omnitrophica bacterium]|nr:hypothetical protein [Candidatus Omnitrophota bacterium]